MAHEDCWSVLTPDLLKLIAKRLEFMDHISFCCVCESWRSAVTQWPQLPLLASCTIDENSSTSTFRFSSFNGADFIPIELESLSNLAPNKLCCGSSHGWLILISPTCRLLLINPFTNSQFDLPPYPSSFLRNQPGHDIDLVNLFSMGHRVVLSSDPSVDPNFLVIQMGDPFSDGLIVWRQGDKTWRQFEHTTSRLDGDALFFGGQIVHATTRDVSAYNIEGDLFWALNAPEFDRVFTSWLVESAGDLLFVRSSVTVGNDFDMTYSFQILKIVMGDNKLVEVESLGDHALFLGYNLAISVRASEYPGCRANCIYLPTHRVSLDDGRNEHINGHLCQIGSIGALSFSLWLKPSLVPGRGSLM